MKVAVAQLGARMHYAVLKILERAGRLEHFYTDARPSEAMRFAMRPVSDLPGMALLRKFLDRYPEGVPGRKITAFHGLGISYSLRLARAKTAEEQASTFLWAGSSFCRKLVRQGLGEATHTFTHNTAGLEWMRHAKSRGLKIVMEQTIAPKEVELRMLRAEQELFPGWEERLPNDASGALREICQRERAEWAEADLILCGSQFVVDGVQACRGPYDRCAVVPYGVDLDARPLKRLPSEGPLRVLTVGSVGLRKGSQYVMETAKLCRGLCEFRMVGPLDASPEALRRLSEHVTLAGPVPRHNIHEHYSWAEVFFLPSVCEGSATAIYEALANGLPVLTTPNAGSVVTHGEDGWLVPVDAVGEMAAYFAWIHGNRDILKEFSLRAAEKAKNYDTVAYGGRLLSSLDKV